MAQFLFAFTFLSAADAQISKYEGRPIADIQFSPEHRLHPDDLAGALPSLRKGGPLRARDVASAIDGLFATGMFEDIIVEAEPAGDGVLVRFRTKSAWFVGGVTMHGKLVTPPNRGQVVNAAQLSLGTPFRDEDLDRAKDAVKQLFVSNGLYDVEINPRVERRDDTQEVFIIMDVKEGKRARYSEPRIHGERLLSDNTIIKATGWRLPLIHSWRRVTEATTRKGVQGVLGRYRKDDRLKAEAELQKMEYDEKTHKVKPILEINAGPKVKIEAVEAKVSKRVMKRYVPVYQEGAVDNDLLTEGKRNLRDYFQSQGYYDVDVDFRVLPAENNVERIEYAISRGPRSKLERVTLAGNNYFSTTDIRERMFLQPASLRLRHGRYSEAFRLKDEENIANLYRSNGFRDVKVASSVERDYKGKPGQLAVTVTVEEGPQWFVDKLTVEGMTQLEQKEVAPLFASIEGQPFSEVNLASDRNEVLSAYFRLGFPEATFRATWVQSTVPNRINVVYTVNEAQRKYVREVVTTGLKSTRRSIIEKNMTLRAGDPLSPIRQVDIQKRFYDLGIFARVDTAIENAEGNTNHKYVLYNFEEANRYTVNMGLGAQLGRFGTPSRTSVASPGGTTGFSPSASVDVSRINFLGLGHVITLRSLYSSIEKRGSLSYLAPRFRNVDGRNVTFTALYDNTLNVQTFASRREEASVQMSQQFSKWSTGLFRLAYRRVSVTNVIIPVLLVPQFLQPARIGIVSANFAQDHRDNPADPHRGMYNTFDIGLSAKFFGSQRSFARALARNATYHKLTRTVVLARQTQFGIITPFAAPPGVTAQQSVPLPERFFGGGADSLRAFPFNQAGPRDTGTQLVASGPSSQPTGFPLGGNALFVNNVELRFPAIGDNIQGVLFHDMGNVYSSIGNMSLRFRQRDLRDFDYTVQAAGIGVRYRTPVGPIRVDFAYSINPPSYIGFSGTPAQLLQCNPELSKLPGFCQGTRRRTSHFQFFFSIGQTF